MGDIWWRQIHRTLQSMDMAAGLVTRSASSSTNALALSSSTAIDSDAPPAAVEILDDRYLDDLQRQEEQELQEEDASIRVIEEFEAEREAARAQAAEEGLPRSTQRP